MKHIFLFVAVLFMIFSNSCSDFLDEEVKGNIATPDFYNNELEAKQGLNGIYRLLNDAGVTGYATRHVPTDLTKRASWDEGGGLCDYTFKSDNKYIYEMWSKHYSIINKVNSVIDNVERNKDRINNWELYVAQAKGIRAYLYFDLLRWFGGVPLIIDEVTTLSNLKVERASQEAVLSQIIKDFEYCANYSMDKGDSQRSYSYGKLTTDAAKGFLAKVYLWIASISKRDEIELLGTAEENFQKSLNYAKAVIDGNRFALSDYYPDVFDAKTREKAVSEVLWCTEGAMGDGTGSWTGMMLGITGDANHGGAWGNIGGTDYHRMIYEPTDSVRRLWNCPRVTILNNGSLWGWDNEIYYNTKPGDVLKPENEVGHYLSWCIGKFRRYPVADLASYNYTNFAMDEPLLRYADILLIYAEAYNEVNHGPGTYHPSSSFDLSGSNVESAYDAVNIVRKRARTVAEGIIHEDVLPRVLMFNYSDNVDSYVPDWKPGSYGFIYDGVRNVWDYCHYTSDYEAFRNEILNERARELVAETTDRWCDLVRRGILVDQMQAWRKFNPFIGKTERNITTPGAPENVKPYHMYLPIPLQELDVNDKLKQNPGY